MRRTARRHTNHRTMPIRISAKLSPDHRPTAPQPSRKHSHVPNGKLSASRHAKLLCLACEALAEDIQQAYNWMTKVNTTRHVFASSCLKIYELWFRQLKDGVGALPSELPALLPPA